LNKLPTYLYLPSLTMNQSIMPCHALPLLMHINHSSPIRTQNHAKRSLENFDIGNRIEMSTHQILTRHSNRLVPTRRSRFLRRGRRCRRRRLFVEAGDGEVTLALTPARPPSAAVDGRVSERIRQSMPRGVKV